MFNKSSLRSLILTLIAISLLGSSSLAQNPSKKDIKKADDLVKQGIRLFGQRNYRNAVEKFAEAAVLVPRNSAATSLDICSRSR